MANYLGVNATKLATNIGANVIDTGMVRAVEYVMYDEYEASSLASGSTITLFDKIPNGAVVTEIIVIADDLGTSSSTFAVGDSNDDNRYLAAYATGSATFKALSTSGVIDTGIGYRIGTNAGDNQILITTAGGVVTTGTIKAYLKYAL
jgi:hypothetical protein